MSYVSRKKPLNFASGFFLGKREPQSAPIANSFLASCLYSCRAARKKTDQCVRCRLLTVNIVLSTFPPIAITFWLLVPEWIR